jgi:hypothetical protein
MAPKETALWAIWDRVGRGGVVSLLSCLLGGGEKDIVEDLCGLREDQQEAGTRDSLDQTLREDEARRRPKGV